MTLRIDGAGFNLALAPVRTDLYGRQFLLSAASGLVLPFNYSRPDTGPAWQLPQQDGSMATFGNTTLPRSFGVGGWGYEFHPGWTQLWPNANDLSLRSSSGFNPIVASGTGPGAPSPAWALTENTTTGVHNLSVNPAYTAGVVHTFSAVARERAGSSKRFLLLVQTASGFGTNLFACFDLATGAWVATAGVVASMQQLADGYWRCNMTSTPTVTGPSNTQVRLANSFAAASSNYTGDGTSGIDVWCINVTNTSYPVPLTFNDANPGIIGNHTMTATTAALGITLGQAFGLGVEYVVAAGSPGSIRGILQVESASGDNRCVVRTGSSAGTYQAIIRNAGANAYIQQGSNTPDGQLNKIALRCNASPNTGINGVLGAVGSGVTVPTDLDRIFIGYGTAAPRLSGRILNAYLIPNRAPSDAELAAMTA